MTLKSITLHRAALNNAGDYIDAGGDDLAVGDKPGEISEDRARELLSQHGGVGHHDMAAAKPTKKKAAKAKSAPKKAAPPPSPTPTPVPVPAPEPVITPELP